MVNRYQNPKVRANRRIAVLIALAVVFASLLAAYNFYDYIYDYIKGREKPISVPAATTESITIFVPGEPVKLIEKKLEVRLGLSERQKADIIIDALKKGRCLPEDLKLYDFAVNEEGVVYLNFS